MKKFFHPNNIFQSQTFQQANLALHNDSLITSDTEYIIYITLNNFNYHIYCREVLSDWGSNKVFGKIENKTSLKLEFVHDTLGVNGFQQVIKYTSKYSFPLGSTTVHKCTWMFHCLKSKSYS